MERALSSYTLPPNPMSISTHYDVPPNLFELYAANSDDCIQPRHTTMPVSPSLQRTSLPDDTWGRRTIETLPGSQLGYEQILAANKDWSGDKPSERLKPVTAERLMRDLRWTNLGWVYQVRRSLMRSFDCYSGLQKRTTLPARNPFHFPSSWETGARTLSQVSPGLRCRGTREKEWSSQIGNDGPMTMVGTCCECQLTNRTRYWHCQLLSAERHSNGSCRSS